MRFIALLTTAVLSTGLARAAEFPYIGFWTAPNLTGPVIPTAGKALASPNDGVGADLTVDFHCVESLAAGKSQDAASTADCLSKAGVSVTAHTEGSVVAFVKNAEINGGGNTDPAGGWLLMQINKNAQAQRVDGEGVVSPPQPISYTLTFKADYAAIVFVRPKIFPQAESGITHPAWAAHVFDAAGAEIEQEEHRRPLPDGTACKAPAIDSEAAKRVLGIASGLGVGQDMICARKAVAAETFLLKGKDGRGIRSIRFDSNGANFTAFSAVLVESLEGRR